MFLIKLFISWYQVRTMKISSKKTKNFEVWYKYTLFGKCHYFLEIFNIYGCQEAKNPKMIKKLNPSKFHWNPDAVCTRN